MAADALARNAKEPTPYRFRVLREFPGDGGRIYRAGDVVTTGPEWPYHRAAQLQRNRYLMALADEADAPRPRRGV